MIKRFCLLAFLVVGFAATAQKQLTLEQSVLQQFRAFRPDMMSGVQWIPNSDRFVYIGEGGKTLMVRSASENKATEMLTLDALKLATSSEVPHLGSLKWEDEHSFIVSAGSDFYRYNTVSKIGTKLLSSPENAENTTADVKYTNIAYTKDNNLFVANQSGEVAVTDNSDKNIVSGQAIARSEFGISNGIFWSPKSKFLAFYVKDESAVADYPLLDITTTPGTLNNIKYPMAGQPSEKPKVGIYNLASKSTVFITPRTNSDDYLTNLAWTPDDKFVIIAEVNRAQNHMQMNLYDAQSGKFVRTLFEEKNSKWVEPEHAAFFPSEKSNNFIYISERDGFNNLYYYSIDGKLLRKLTNNKFPALEILNASADGKEIFFSATGPNPTNVLAYKVDLKGKQTLLTKEDGVHSISVSTDGKWIFDQFSNPTTPSKSVLHDKNGKTTLLLQSANKYADYAIGTSEIKTIKAADGTTDLYTRLIKPSNFDASKKYPVFVYVYGGPHAQMITNSYMNGANLWMYWMAEQGYLVFTVDNRGSANRGFEFESVIHRRLGVHEMDDQIKGVEYLKSLPYVDANRLAVHGWSYGGFMTTSLMLRHPGVFTTGVAGGPVTDWKYYEIMYGERYMDSPTDNPEGYAESSTLKYAKDLKGNLLLIHGTSDDVVVMQHNYALIKKFIEAEKQVDFFPYPMHKHNVGGKDRVHLIQKVLDYVIKNNQ